jgi:hypothetical protein
MIAIVDGTPLIEVPYKDKNKQQLYDGDVLLYNKLLYRIAYIHRLNDYGIGMPGEETFIPTWYRCVRVGHITTHIYLLYPAKII